jgi:hypothetical protein
MVDHNLGRRPIIGCGRHGLAEIGSVGDRLVNMLDRAVAAHIAGCIAYGDHIDARIALGYTVNDRIARCGVRALDIRYMA